MPVSTSELDEIGKTLTAPDTDSSVFVALRAKFPHLTWTRCDASDVVEDPFQTHGGFDLHLIDTSDHCAQIVTDPERATGIVLAKRSETV